MSGGVRPPAGPASRRPPEALEQRCLLSAYTPSALAYFGLTPNGSTPQASLVADANGNLFGTTQYGGSANEGTVFEIAKGSTAVTTLASFSPAVGYAPQGGVSVDSAGNLYGITPLGGANGDGTVYEIAAGSNAITAIASFTSSMGNGVGGITLDGSGNLYGVMYVGGTSSEGAVFEIARSSSTFTTLASFTGLNGAGPHAALSFDAAGNLYGTTYDGGMYGYGSVFELPNGASRITSLASFDGADGIYGASSLTLDPAGDLFGTTNSGGTTSNGTVFEIASGSTTITTLASFNNTNGRAPTGAPVLDSAGDLFGTTANGGTYGDGAAFEIASGSNAITTLAAFNGADGSLPNGSVVMDPAGNLYGTTEQGGMNGNGSGSGNVFEIANGSNTITQVVAFGPKNPGPPDGVILDPEGDLLGATAQGGPFNDGTVFELPRGSNSLTTFASFNGTDGSQPGGLTVDASGNLYGTAVLGGGASNPGTVFEIASGSTTITTIATFNGATGNDPGMVTLDASGDLFGTTEIGGPGGGGVVYEIAKGSSAFTILASFSGANGKEPHGSLTLDPAGNLYGTTFYGGAKNDGTVWELAKGSGAITTLHSFGGADGSGPIAGVTLDPAGNLFGTTDQGGALADGTVFEIPVGSSVLTTLVSFNGTNGSFPQGAVMTDPAGNLFGTTSSGGASGNGTVYEIAKGSNVSTTLLSFSATGPYGGRPASLTPDGVGSFYVGTYTTGGSSTGALVELAANTALTLTPTSPNPSNANEPLSFIASVSGGVPDGEAAQLVDASNHDAVVASGTLSGGSATLAVAAGTLAPGIRDLIAAYAGDTNFAASESAAFAQIVKAQPSVIASPVSLTMPAGQTVTFTAAAGGYPIPTVQWQVSADGGKTFADLPGANAPTLSFTAAESQNGYAYRAVFTNSLGTATTTAATLTVTTPVFLTGRSPDPSNGTQPLTFTVTVGGGVSDGETVTLEDTSNGSNVVATGALAGGSATLTVPAGTLLAGTHVLVAAYAGDANFQPGQSSTYVQWVQLAVTRVVVNGNLPALAGVQRSMVDSLVYTFSEAVNLAAANAFSIAVHVGQTGTAPTLSWAALNPNADGSSAQWVVMFGGAGVSGGSIADGVYDITLNGSAATSDANPTVSAPSRTDTFFRLFGDVTGDGRVNNADYNLLLNSFNLKSGQAGYLAALDATGTGSRINNADYNLFLNNFNVRFTGFTATI